MMNVDWTKSPKEAQYYCPATGLVHAAWFYKEDGLYYACLEGKTEWFEEAYQENCKEWQWIARPEMTNDQKSLEVATEIMELVKNYDLTSQLKAKIQCVIIKALEKSE